MKMAYYYQVVVIMSYLVITWSSRLSSVSRRATVVFSELHHPSVMSSIVTHPSLAAYNHTAIMANRDPLYHAGSSTLRRIARSRDSSSRPTRSIDIQPLGEIEIELEVVLKLLPLFETANSETHAGIINELELDLPSLSEEDGRSLNDDLMPLVNNIEKVLKMMGVDGEACILRAVCEVSSTPHIQPLGLSGEMLHVLFRYFISSEYSGGINQVGELTGPNTRKKYIDAGLKGRTAGSTICSLQYPTCPLSVFNLASHPKC